MTKAIEDIKNSFDQAINRIGLETLPCAVFYSAPYGIRFQIGGDEDIYLGDHRKPNGAYIENAVDRALRIYAQLPAALDILRIDECLNLSIPGLPKPDQTDGNSCYWCIPREPAFLRKLFREIVKAEIDSTGIENLVSNVYFLNSHKDVLFHLYDDRGADVVAADKEILRPLYESCKDWILDYDREKIDLLFESRLLKRKKGAQPHWLCPSLLIKHFVLIVPAFPAGLPCRW